MTDLLPSAPFVRPDVGRFLSYLSNLPGPRTHEVDAVTARAMMTSTIDLADLPRGELAIVRELSIPGPAGPVPARLFDGATGASRVRRFCSSTAAGSWCL